jgi:hypothetical protein
MFLSPKELELNLRSQTFAKEANSLLQQANGPLRITRNPGTNVLYMRVRTWSEFRSEMCNVITFGFFGTSMRKAQQDAFEALNTVFNNDIPNIHVKNQPLAGKIKSRLQLGVMGVFSEEAEKRAVPDGINCVNACPWSIVADKYLVDESGAHFIGENSPAHRPEVFSQQDFKESKSFIVQQHGKNKTVYWHDEDTEGYTRYFEEAYLWMLHGCREKSKSDDAEEAMTIVIEPQPDPQFSACVRGSQARVSQYNAAGLVSAMRRFQKECKDKGRLVCLIAASTHAADHEQVQRALGAVRFDLP